MEMFWVVALKGFVGLVLWGTAYGIAMLVMRLIPQGRLKALLGRPLRRGIRERRWPVPPGK
jgi:hypothetical protein